MLYQIRVLKHVMNNARRWSASGGAGASAGATAPGAGKRVKVYLTGANMFYDNATGEPAPRAVLLCCAALREAEAPCASQE